MSCLFFSFRKTQIFLYYIRSCISQDSLCISLIEKKKIKKQVKPQNLLYIFEEYFDKYGSHSITFPLPLLMIFISSVGILGGGNSEAQVSNVLVDKAKLIGTTIGVRIKTSVILSQASYITQSYGANKHMYTYKCVRPNKKNEGSFLKFLYAK